jgi:subtilase family serine protease
MIRVKSMLLVGVLAGVAFALPKAQAMMNLPAAPAAPDLVVMEVTSPNLDGGVVKVHVKNQGNAPAAACYMAIRVTPLGGKSKVFSPKVPALAAGEETDVEAQTGFLLSQAAFEAIVDRSNTVKESNEANNSRKGKFGGKP